VSPARRWRSCRTSTPMGGRPITCLLARSILKPIRSSRSRSSPSGCDCRDIEGQHRALTAVACSSTRSINAFDLNMIYIIDPGYQKLAIDRHQTAVGIVSVFWGAIERAGEAAVQASRGRKHGLQRGPHALSRQR
jgi:hypothetical protein